MVAEELHRICQVCNAKVPGPVSLKYNKFGDLYGQKVAFIHCDECGFTSAPENRLYPGCAPLWSEKHHFRAGSEDAPGREFYMAVMGYEIMQLAGIACESVLIFGAGNSVSHAHLKKRFQNLEIRICDLSNSQNAENFIPPDSNTTFDIVIACEVVEHFTNIREHFTNLLSKVSGSGLVIISTDISANENWAESMYPFIPDHTAYYSGRSLRLAIERFDKAMLVDFRVPEGLGKNKRYAICYKDSRLMSAISEHFSTHFMAPSEQRAPLSLWMRLRRFGFRYLRYLKISWMTVHSKA
ncbi:MAG: methyltransferase domain-containing protein [Gammaproteobacteria bacterium]